MGHQDFGRSPNYGRVKPAVLAALKARGPMTVADLMAAVGHGRNGVWQALRGELLMGRVWRRGWVRVNGRRRAVYDLCDLASLVEAWEEKTAAAERLRAEAEAAANEAALALAACRAWAAEHTTA